MSKLTASVSCINFLITVEICTHLALVGNEHDSNAFAPIVKLVLFAVLKLNLQHKTFVSPCGSESNYTNMRGSWCHRLHHAPSCCSLLVNMVTLPLSSDKANSAG